MLLKLDSSLTAATEFFQRECYIIMQMKHSKNLNPERFELGDLASTSELLELCNELLTLSTRPQNRSFHVFQEREHLRSVQR